MSKDNGLTSSQKTAIVVCAGITVMSVIVGICYAVPKITEQVLGNRYTTLNNSEN